MSANLLDELCRHLGTADSELRWALDRAAKRKVKFPEATHDVIIARAKFEGIKLALGTVLHAQAQGGGITGDVHWTYGPTRLADEYLYERRLAALARVRAQQAAQHQAEEAAQAEAEEIAAQLVQVVRDHAA